MKNAIFLKQLWLGFMLLGFSGVSRGQDNDEFILEKGDFSKFENSSTYTFNPLNVKRDPFNPPGSQDREDKTLTELTRYDINEMNLIAIMTGLGPPQAMLVVPNGKAFVVKVGDEIGRRGGKVSKILASEIIVKEVFKDYQDRQTIEETRLVLAQ